MGLHSQSPPSFLGVPQSSTENLMSSFLGCNRGHHPPFVGTRDLNAANQIFMYLNPLWDNHPLISTNHRNQTLAASVMLHTGCHPQGQGQWTVIPFIGEFIGLSRAKWAFITDQKSIQPKNLSRRVLAPTLYLSISLILILYSCINF